MEESVPVVPPKHPLRLPPASIHGRLLLSFWIGHLLQILADNVIKFGLKQKGREIVKNFMYDWREVYITEKLVDIRRIRGCQEQSLWSQSRWTRPCRAQAYGSPSAGKESWVKGALHQIYTLLMQKCGPCQCFTIR